MNTSHSASPYLACSAFSSYALHVTLFSTNKIYCPISSIQISYKKKKNTYMDFSLSFFYQNVTPISMKDIFHLSLQIHSFMFSIFLCTLGVCPYGLHQHTSLISYFSQGEKNIVKLRNTVRRKWTWGSYSLAFSLPSGCQTILYREQSIVSSFLLFSHALSGLESFKVYPADTNLALGYHTVSC